MEQEKQHVHDFWNQASCGEDLYMKGESLKDKYINQSKERYILEPEILIFAEFDKYIGKKVLEIGVGLGSDHQKWAEAGTDLWGCDLTPRAIENTRTRFELFDLKSNLSVADAEKLPFDSNFFDVVYSWGVIHHSPNTMKASDEILRVLKPEGKALIMIYHKYSMVGFMLWIRYALLKGNPFKSLDDIYSKYLESPKTKAYTRKEAKEKLFSKFNIVSLETPLAHGDLLTSEAGQRHKGFLLSLARIIYPRFLIRTFCKNNGLEMMIKLEKPNTQSETNHTVL